MKKVIHGVANIYLLISLLGLLALIGILTVEIISRYFFSSSIVWSHEFFSILICWITFLGFGKVVVGQEDIMITFLVKKVSAAQRKVVIIVNTILMFIVSSSLLYFSIVLTLSHINRSTVIMKASSAWFYSPLALLMALVVLVSIRQMILAFKSELNMFPDVEEE